MLIEFSVGNFLSFKERQTFSMVAAQGDDSLEENLIPLSMPGMANLRLLKTAVLYGANASGKSNLLSAMYFMDWFVENSATKIKPDASTTVTPFRLCKEYVSKPSEFEILFIAEKVRYQFGFVLDNTRVCSEWLYAYPEGKAQRWYQRDFNVSTGKYEWEFSQKHFRGAKEILKQQTRANALFLSTSAQLNNEQLLTVYRWFQRDLNFLDMAGNIRMSGIVKTISQLSESASHRSLIEDMIRRADFGISSVNVKEVDFSADKLPKDMPDSIKNEIMEKIGKDPAKIQELRWHHRAQETGETVVFETEMESEGTLRYFSFLGPCVNALETGGVVAIDEFGSNIHPLLSHVLLKTMHHAKISENNAQLIAATHDTTLLDKEFLRRDQIWFVEKNPEGASNLYPLTDFHPRGDASFGRGYLSGRFGAIPFLTGDLLP